MSAISNAKHRSPVDRQANIDGSVSCGGSETGVNQHLDRTPANGNGLNSSGSLRAGHARTHAQNVSKLSPNLTQPT